MNAGYYIYYRVAPDQAERARRILSALQDDVLKDTGVRGRLLQRRDDPSTWMEIYDEVENEIAFEQSLAAALERRGFSGLLASGSQRMAEIFTPL